MANGYTRQKGVLQGRQSSVKSNGGGKNRAKDGRVKMPNNGSSTGKIKHR